MAKNEYYGKEEDYENNWWNESKEVEVDDIVDKEGGEGEDWGERKRIRRENK